MLSNNLLNSLNLNYIFIHELENAIIIVGIFKLCLKLSGPEGVCNYVFRSVASKILVTCTYNTDETRISHKKSMKVVLC